MNALNRMTGPNEKMVTEFLHVGIRNVGKKGGPVPNQRLGQRSGPTASLDRWELNDMGQIEWSFWEKRHRRQSRAG